MDYFDFTLDSCCIKIRLLKNSIMAQRGITYLNGLITIWQFYQVFNNPINTFIAVVAGTVLANSLWCATQLWMLKQDLKLEKERLARLEQSRDDENFKGMLKQIESTKNYYSELVNKLKTGQGI